MTLQRQKKLRTTQRTMLRLIFHTHCSYYSFENYAGRIVAETSKLMKVMHDQKMDCLTVLQRRKIWNWAEIRHRLEENA